MFLKPAVRTLPPTHSNSLTILSHRYQVFVVAEAGEALTILKPLIIEFIFVRRGAVNTFTTALVNAMEMLLLYLLLWKKERDLWQPTDNMNTSLTVLLLPLSGIIG